MRVVAVLLTGIVLGFGVVRRWRTVQFFVRHFKGMCAMCILYMNNIHVQGICTKRHKFRQCVSFSNIKYLRIYFKTGRYFYADASADGASENKYNILSQMNNNIIKREKCVSERK